MKVFLAWSGDKSEKIAKAIFHFLERVVPNAEAFLSAHIELGTNWVLALDKELAECRFGIIVLTQDALDSNWIHFESGAISKSVDAERTNVVPVFFGIEPTEYKGPLTYFQLTLGNRENLLELAKLINSKLEKQGKENILEEYFNQNWGKLDEEIQSAISIPIAGVAVARRGPTEMIAEVLDSVRRMEPAVNELSKGAHRGWPISPDLLRRAIAAKVRMAALEAQAAVIEQLKTQLAGDQNDPVNTPEAFLQRYNGSELDSVRHNLMIILRHARFNDGYGIGLGSQAGEYIAGLLD